MQAPITPEERRARLRALLAGRAARDVSPTRAFMALATQPDPRLLQLEIQLRPGGPTDEALDDLLLEQVADWAASLDDWHPTPRWRGADDDEALFTIVLAQQRRILRDAWLELVRRRRASARPAQDPLWIDYLAMRSDAVQAGGWGLPHEYMATHLVERHGTGPVPTGAACRWLAGHAACAGGRFLVEEREEEDYWLRQLGRRGAATGRLRPPVSKHEDVLFVAPTFYRPEVLVQLLDRIERFGAYGGRVVVYAGGFPPEWRTLATELAQWPAAESHGLPARPIAPQEDLHVRWLRDV